MIISPVPGVPPFITVQTRGQAAANEWWLTAGQDLGLSRSAAESVLNAIADLVEREHGAVEQQVRESLGMHLSEMGAAENLLDFVLQRKASGHH